MSDALKSRQGSNPAASLLHGCGISPTLVILSSLHVGAEKSSGLTDVGLKFYQISEHIRIIVRNWLR